MAQTAGEVFDLPLYHGTSTLFLEDIRRLGLGAKDPLEELGVLDLARDIQPLLDEHAADHAIYKRRRHSFELMIQQRAGSRNFQHGQTYVSPSPGTAVRYAVNKRYGSELLTYTLDLLQVLVDKGVPAVTDSLYRRHRRLFQLLDVSPAPLLVELAGVPTGSLQAEDGSDPTNSFEHVRRMKAEFPDRLDVMLQQTNFRLKSGSSPECMRLLLISVTRWDSLSPEYLLYELVPQQRV